MFFLNLQYINCTQISMYNTKEQEAEQAFSPIDFFQKIGPKLALRASLNQKDIWIYMGKRLICELFFNQKIIFIGVIIFSIFVKILYKKEESKLLYKIPKNTLKFIMFGISINTMIYFISIFIFKPDDFLEEINNNLYISCFNTWEKELVYLIPDVLTLEVNRDKLSSIIISSVEFQTEFISYFFYNIFSSFIFILIIISIGLSLESIWFIILSISSFIICSIVGSLILLGLLGIQVQQKTNTSYLASLFQFLSNTLKIYPVLLTAGTRQFINQKIEKIASNVILDNDKTVSIEQHNRFKSLLISFITTIFTLSIIMIIYIWHCNKQTTKTKEIIETALQRFEIFEENDYNRNIRKQNLESIKRFWRFIGKYIIPLENALGFYLYIDYTGALLSLDDKNISPLQKFFLFIDPNIDSCKEILNEIMLKYNLSKYTMNPLGFLIIYENFILSIISFIIIMIWAPLSVVSVISSAVKCVRNYSIIESLFDKNLQDGIYVLINGEMIVGKNDQFPTSQPFQFRFNQNSQFMASINIHIKNGERLGILGGSGLGKSTFLYLISQTFLQMLKNEELVTGTLLVGVNRIEGKKIIKEYVPLKDIAHRCFSNFLIYIVQKNGLFLDQLTIIEIITNKTLSTITLRESEMAIKALEQSCLYAKISALPNGMKTPFGQIKLSGGESRRLAIAVALFDAMKKVRYILSKTQHLKPGPDNIVAGLFVIIDECLTGLDPITASILWDLIIKAFQDLRKFGISITIIGVEHTLEIVANSTILMVFAAYHTGTKIEIGIHKDLLKKSEAYRSIFIDHKHWDEKANLAKIVSEVNDSQKKLTNKQDEKNSDEEIE